jgi:hypothetical protein
MMDECGCGAHYGKDEGYCRCGTHRHEHDFRRRFLTKAEKTDKLRKYAEELKLELKAIEEEIEEMQN